MTTLIFPAVAVLLVMLYIYYLMWQKIKEPQVITYEDDEEEFSFPEADTLRMRINQKEFVGVVVARSYMDDVPTLVLKGFINKNTLSYLYFFGDEVIDAAMLSTSTLSSSQKNFITRITPQQSAVHYFDGENFLPLTDEKALIETRVQLQIMEETPEEAGSYNYDYDSDTEHLSIVKEENGWQTLPLRLFHNMTEHALPWRYMFALFALLLTSLYLFRLDPTLTVKGSISMDVISLAFMTFTVMNIYMFMAYFLNKNYIMMFLSPIYAVVLTMIGFPLVLSTYALLFGLNQSPFTMSIKGYKSPYIKVSNDNNFAKFETDYGWFSLQNENNATKWVFKEKYLELPYEMQSEVDTKDQAAVVDAIKRLKALEPQDGEGTLCDLRPCRVVTHHEVFERIQIKGTVAFGNYVADSVRVLHREVKEAPYDRYTLTLYPVETLLSLPTSQVKTSKSVAVVIPKNDENVTMYDLVVNQCIYAKRDAQNKIIMKVGFFNIKDAKYGTPVYNITPYIKMREGYELSQERVDSFLSKVIEVDTNAKSFNVRKLSSDNIYVLSTAMDYQLHLELKTINNRMVAVTILNHMRKPCPDVDLAIGDMIGLDD